MIAKKILFFVFIIIIDAYSNDAFVPFYIEDNHAGTFYWAVNNLDLSQDYQLVVFDEHFDAGQIVNSDGLRQSLQKGHEERSVDIARWQKEGIIQSYNWLEPLISHPFKKILWVYPGKEEFGSLYKKANTYFSMFDAILKKGIPQSLSGKLKVSKFASYEKSLDSELLTVVTIDLDYFNVFKSNQDRNNALEAVLDSVNKMPRLAGVSFSISYPYLNYVTELDSMLITILSRLMRTGNARLQFEPFAKRVPDRSEKAKEFYKKHKNVPSYNIEEASTLVKSFFLQQKEKTIVSISNDRWTDLLNKWRMEYELPSLKMEAEETLELKKGTYYQLASKQFSVSLADKYQQKSVVSWYFLKPVSNSFNVTEIQHTFASNKPKAIYYKSQEMGALKNKKQIGSRDLIPYFDHATTLGQISFFAVVCYGKDCFLTNTLTVARFKDTSYLGQLTKVFNLPYIFGERLLTDSIVSNKWASKLGSDCSSFIAFGGKEFGKKIGYGNPKQLADQMIFVDNVKSFQKSIAIGDRGAVKLTPEGISDGLILNFGRHIVAIYEDRGVLGVLDKDDLIIHQLEDYPQIVPLNALKQHLHPFKIYKFRVMDSIKEKVLLGQ